ncbi:MAG: PilZ domain-containing protein [Gammaproteobacteria bacterium]|nr:PilZ domain-containing protein [Gammaproteobacteria bacterium]MBQ0840510.1 PilZ domain-containing protein [Gammaproteobacteria bacterium]
MSEQRKFTRIKFDASSSLSSAQERWEVELLDISLRGALLQSAYREGLSIGCDVSVLIDLTNEAGGIELHGKVVHIEADHIGVSSTHMDIDSISQLRRIVELNLGDSELLQREIAALVESVANAKSEG